MTTDSDLLVWIGIAFCVSQSAIFSGLNLAFFSLPRLQLEADAKHNRRATRVLQLRRDSNFLLTTILWGNVGINVLLTLLSNSVLTGVAAFLFSTVVITFLGEIIPQAFFSRHALRMASLLAPVLRFYQLLLYPVAKPAAWFLDRWLGKEKSQFFLERSIRHMLISHVDSHEAELDAIEGIGALNFLDIDDTPAESEGERVDPRSIIRLPTRIDLPLAPNYQNDPNDEFLRQVNASRRKWVILADSDGEPQLLLDADGFLRAALFTPGVVDMYRFCHRPIIVRDEGTPLGDVLLKLKLGSATRDDEAIKRDVVLVWTDRQRRIITGADILGRLLFGVDRDVAAEAA